MATMNKPASNSTSWYQALTDNWTSIESNLVDKSIVTAKGDLIAATGSAALARLGAGSYGQFLKADSVQSSGLKWDVMNLFSTQDVIDVLWGKKFFQDEGFLPSTKMFEYVGTPPAFTGTAGLATWTPDPGAMRPNNSGIGWYDLAAAKSKILVVVGNCFKLGADLSAIFLTSSVPTGLNPDGYSAWNDASGPDIWKKQGGWTRLDSGTGFDATDYMSGYALYYDGVAGVLKLFLRMGCQWFLAQSGTDSAFTTMRYVSFQAQVLNQRWVTPFVCYAQ